MICRACKGRRRIRTRYGKWITCPYCSRGPSDRVRPLITKFNGAGARYPRGRTIDEMIEDDAA